MPESAYYIVLAILVALFGILARLRRETHEFGIALVSCGLLILGQGAHLLGYHYIATETFFPATRNAQIHVVALFFLFVVSVMIAAQVYLWSVRR